jgi:two-component system OmpR family sensor kinase
MLLLVLIIEIAVPNNPTLGGMLLLAVLFGTWLLPTSYAAAITVLAIVVTLITALTGAVDPLTAKFQFVAVVVTACLSELTVRSLMARDRAQLATTDQLRRFTADAAHELRNPLSALQSDLEITLLQPRTSDELTATVRLALKNTQRLVKISESLLTLSRSDSGGLVTSVAPIDISDVLEEAYARWESHAIALGVHLTEQLHCEGVVEGDPLLLGRLFDNLLENAIGYTPQGGTVTLTLTAAPPGSCAISITDTGPGIPATLRPVIFERFSRGDASRSRKTGGAGLGLAICAAIVSAHKGTITLDDEHVGGTRIVVRLPVTRLSGRV